MNRIYPTLDPERLDAAATAIVRSVYGELERKQLTPTEVQIESAPPYTMVRIADELYCGIGFSKCSPRDPFDAITGFKIALDRAVRSYLNNPTRQRQAAVHVA